MFCTSLSRDYKSKWERCFIFILFQEVAEPLQDLKEGMDQLEKNKTLRYILTTLLAIGNFLNSTNVSKLQDIYGSEAPAFSLSLPLCL